MPCSETEWSAQCLSLFVCFWARPIIFSKPYLYFKEKTSVYLEVELVWTFWIFEVAVTYWCEKHIWVSCLLSTLKDEVCLENPGWTGAQLTFLRSENRSDDTGLRWMYSLSYTKAKSTHTDQLTASRDSSCHRMSVRKTWNVETDIPERHGHATHRSWKDSTSWFWLFVTFVLCICTIFFFLHVRLESNAIFDKWLEEQWKRLHCWYWRIDICWNTV